MVRVVLELEPGEPIAGRALVGDGRPVSFTGWMGLYAAIDGARDGEAGEPAPGPGSEPPADSP